MTDERWPREGAVSGRRGTAGRRTRRLLAAATGDDAALRREVESLLAADTSDADVLAQLPVASESVLADPLAALSTAMHPAPSHTVLAAGLRVGPYEIVAPRRGRYGRGLRARHQTRPRRRDQDVA